MAIETNLISSPTSPKHKTLSPIITNLSPTQSPPPSLTTNKLNCFPLHLILLTLSILTTALSLAILGTAIHTYHTYKSQTLAVNPWWLPIWPGHFSTTGTRAVIGASGGIALLNLAFLMGEFGGKARWLSARPMVAALSSILVPIVSVLLGIFSVILTHLLNTRSSGFDTIQSWTCKFSTALPTTPMVLGETRGEMSNEKFGILCSESRFGLWGMVAVVILQVLMGGCAVGEWIVSRRRGVDSRRKEKGMEMGVIETDRKTEFSFQEE